MPFAKLQTIFDIERMHTSLHHPVFIVLSLTVAVLGSWTALDLFRRVRTHVGRARITWVSVAAIAMGLSIWSMHFVAMLGFDPGSAVRYDPVLTLLSLVLATGATWAAFLLASRSDASTLALIGSGAAMGAGVCIMHYVGMAALRTVVSLGYRPWLVALSLVIAIAASIAALFAARRERSAPWRALAAVLLGGAVVGMHYTAMAALKLGPSPAVMAAPSGAPPFVLGLSVAAGTVMILFLALMASLYDQRGNVLSALDAGGVGYWEFDLKSEALHVSRRGKELLGVAPSRELAFADLLDRIAPQDQARPVKALESILRTGGGVYDVEFRLIDQDRWVNVRGRMALDASGRPRRLIGVLAEVTDRHEAFAAVSESGRRQRLLINELNHRVKNTLATIQSIALQTGRGAADVQEFQRNFQARLMSLAKTHDALTRSNWESLNLPDLLRAELAPYASDRVRLAGPDVALEPRQALALGMVFHEMATNAAKYGALSAAAGRVDVAWRVQNHGEAGARLALDWRESGGPPVSPPARAGFGSRLIPRSIEHELSGRAELNFARDGLRAGFVIPLPDRSLERAPFDF